MPDLRIIRERDSHIRRIVEEFMPLALEFTARGSLPKTSGVFLSFVASTEFIKDGILDLAETENVYASKILFRSLIEHFLRFHYLWFRVLAEKSDAAAEEYLKQGSIKEALQVGRSWKRVAKNLGRDSGVTLHDALRDVLKEEIAGLSNKEIDQQASQFEYARMIEYIFEKVKWSNDEDIPFVLKFIPNYSDLSCFVHGAPGAMSIMRNLEGQGQLTTDLINMAELAFDMAGTVKMFSLLTFCQYDKQFSSPYLKISKLLRPEANNPSAKTP